MRYFFISYSVRNNNITAEGNLLISQDKFPNNNYLRNYIDKEYGYEINDLVIMNLFEFKNKKDYLDFKEIN